jgi:hypothetical protein
MPGTARKTPAAKLAADSTPVTSENPEDIEGQDDDVQRPKLTVADLQDVLVELLDHATLRDAKELPRLRARLTGEEVPEDGDEESATEGDGEG